MGRGFLGPRGMTAQPAGEENEPAVAGGRSSRATQGVPGQICPIETATGEPCAKV
jgi:hypothetical protein